MPWANRKYLMGPMNAEFSVKGCFVSDNNGSVPSPKIFNGRKCRAGHIRRIFAAGDSRPEGQIFHQRLHHLGIRPFFRLRNEVETRISNIGTTVTSSTAPTTASGSSPKNPDPTHPVWPDVLAHHRL